MPPEPPAFAATSPTPTLGRAGVTLDWGRTAYADSCARQDALVAARLAGGPDTLVFTEHEPVFTLGVRPGAASHLLWDSAELTRRGVAVAETNRGGDITYHGPGQLVGYPIVSLEARRDLHAYLRFLEEVLICTVAHFGLTATRNPGRTGIWLGSRKIAALGVGVRRWVTSHGFALNVHPDLSHFGGIVPCGITAAEGTVTSMQAELGRPVELAAVKQVLTNEFWRLWPDFLAGRDS